MIDYMMKQKVMLEDINIKLNELITTFIGKTEPTENEVVCENCAMDTIKNNLTKIETIGYNLNRLEEIIKGGE